MQPLDASHVQRVGHSGFVLYVSHGGGGGGGPGLTPESKWDVLSTCVAMSYGHFRVCVCVSVCVGALSEVCTQLHT